MLLSEWVCHHSVRVSSELLEELCADSLLLAYSLLVYNSGLFLADGLYLRSHVLGDLGRI